MKKIFNWVLVKTFFVIAIIAFVIYYAYQYFTDKNGGGAVTGNSGLNNSTSTRTKTVFDKTTSLLDETIGDGSLGIKEGDNVKVTFNKTVTLQGDYRRDTAIVTLPKTPDPLFKNPNRTYNQNEFIIGKIYLGAFPVGGTITWEDVKYRIYIKDTVERYYLIEEGSYNTYQKVEGIDYNGINPQDILSLEKI